VARQIEKEKQIAQGSITGGSDDIYLTRISYPRANNVSIITRAKVPTTPIKPKKQLNMLIAIIVGLFGGAGLAFFLEYQDMTIKTIEDIKSLTKWTVLGSVPEIKTLDRELHVLKNPNDLFSESYRASITRIFFKGEKETIKSIAISSFGPGEGKTTTACTLALLTAEKKKKVLLVDADLRKPRLSGIFSLTGQKGLGEYLSDECAIREVIQKTDIANLSVVAEKKSSLNPALLFSNEKLDQFISEAKKDFDYIIFDTPPMGALSESLILARKVDSLILVVESGKTPKKALIRNQQVLDESGINCTGLILLKTRLVGSENYYYSSKYYNKR
jgi:succinoglycan biosynthesis transport protein ExoP